MNRVQNIRDYMKPFLFSAVSILLTATMIAGCASNSTGGRESVLPDHPLTRNRPNIAEQIAAANAATAAIRQRIGASVKIIQTGDQAQIFVRGKLADSITMNMDGTETDAFVGSGNVTVGRPMPSGIHPMMLKRVSPACSDLAALVSSLQTELNWQTAAVILALGATVAAAVFTVGWAAVPAGAADTAVVGTYLETKSALDSARQSYAAAGC